MDSSGRVEGSRNEHRIVFYGLSTCIWCRKTRSFLEEENLTFQFFYVDLLEGEEKERIVERVREWNPSVSFPTIVFDEERCVIGYKPDEIKEAVK